MPLWLWLWAIDCSDRDDDRCCVGVAAVQSPRVDTPPLNHIGLWIDDLEAAVKWLTSAGVRFTPGGIRKGAAGYNVTFIHPKART